MRDATSMPAEVRVAIVGSGFAGLGTAIRLKRDGVDDFLVLERAGDVGGTWRDNRYPGCACDVQSYLYEFSFAPNPDWSRRFSPQPEIQAYLRRTAESAGVLPHLRFDCEVRGARWDDAVQRWRLDTARGPLVAAVLVIAAGALSDPVVPALPGLETFAGPAFHSARWDDTVDLTGRRVAVIGTGASAVQFVPRLQPHVATLHVYQRTPPWIMPRRDRATSARTHRLFRRAPVVQRALRASIWAGRELLVPVLRHRALARLVQRAALRHLRLSVPDPTLRAVLTPDYTIGCKRILISDDYLPALARPNVAVVTARVAEVRPHAIVDASGVERPTDVIVFGTGFRPTDPPLAPCLVGRDARTLAETWAGSPRAHVGTTVAGFPNLFVLPGPNTGLGHTSVVYMLEAQIDHVMGALRHMARHGIGAIEPRPEAQEAFVHAVDARMRGTVWTAGGCASWYLDRTGRNSTLWPDFTWRFRRAARFVPSDYLATAACSP
ncbi:MAG: flavin-containing monooxygenase [Gemmatirosa sp.]